MPAVQLLRTEVIARFRPPNPRTRSFIAADGTQRMGIQAGCIFRKDRGCRGDECDTQIWELVRHVLDVDAKPIQQ